NFHNYEWFSNVVISSEENDWHFYYWNFSLKKDKDPINLTLLRWYDDVDKEMYGYPRLWLTD
ncbi:18011_t:CDS:2, partial [Funneliformis geosporum]